MITPFRGNRMSEVDLEKLDRLTDFLIEGGLQGLMPLGTSSEFALLNFAERSEVVRRVVRKANGRVPVIAGVSDPGTRNAVEYAVQAEKEGADAIISTGPYYYKTNENGLYLHYQMIMDNTTLPLMIYNIPSYVGYNIPPNIVNQLCENNPGRVAGVKFTTNDLSMFLEYLRLLKGKMQIMIGSDSLFFSALELGAAGGILGSANVLPNETSQIYNSYSNGDIGLAKEIQQKIDGFTSVMALGTYPSSLKEAMKLLGLDCGEVRPPLVPLSPEERKKVRDSLSWRTSVSSLD